MALKLLPIAILLLAVLNTPSLAADPTESGPTVPAPTEPAPKPTDAQPTDAPDMPKMKCVKAGYMCSDCNNQAVCIGNGVDFIQIENQCVKGSHCMGDACVPNAKCNYRPFVCSDQGFFPDPFDCTKYHVCMFDPINKKYKPLDMDCGPERGSYDAASGSCGFLMNSTACMEGPVPMCVSPLQIGVLKSDPSMYYLCTEDATSIGPQLFKCSGGKIFDPKKMSCVPAKKAKK